MNIFALTACLLILTVCLSVVKHIRPEYALAAGALIALTVVGMSLGKLAPLLDYLMNFDFIEENAEYIKCSLKALGVALVCSVASEICRDFGESALAFGVELFAKCEILALTLPMIVRILDIAKDIMK